MEQSETNPSRLDRIEGNDLSIGNRQTVDTVEFEGLGRGRLVWDNGPAMFIPDAAYGTYGYRIARADLGGYTKGVGSWRRVYPRRGEPALRVKLIEHGESHSRWFSPVFGDGWLVFESGAHHVRFETLEGERRLRFSLSAAGVGRPDYYQKMVRSRSSSMPKMTDPDENNWNTYVSSTGEMFTFRRGGPPPAKEDGTQLQLGLDKL